MFRMRILLLACLLLAGLAPAPSQTTQKSWSWPAIPGCLADPAINTGVTPDYNSPVCKVYQKLLDSREADLELESSLRLNAQLDGVLYPAFLPGAEAVSFIVSPEFSKAFTGPYRLVRVSGKSVSALNGSWWTTLSTISDENGHLMTPEQIRAKLAITDTPSCIAYEDSVKTGVRGYMGAIAPAFDEPGGGSQFWFPPGAVVATTAHPIPGSTGCDAP